MSEENLSWGATRIVISKEQFERIFELLDCNNDDIVSVFEIATGDDVLQPICAQSYFLRQIDRMRRYRLCHGRTFGYIWKVMQWEAEQCNLIVHKIK